MSRALWWCLLALVSCCRGSPVGHITTCEEFGSEATFHPQQLIGNWTTVYAWMPIIVNSTETFIISELNSSELEQHHNIVKEYPESALKLKLRIQYICLHGHMDVNILNVLIPTDSSGNADVWTVNVSVLYDTVASSAPIVEEKYTIKWQKVGGFLIIMFCQQKKAIVLADTSTPNEAKLQKVVADVHFEGFALGRIYSDSI